MAPTAPAAGAGTSDEKAARLAAIRAANAGKGTAAPATETTAHLGTAAPAAPATAAAPKAAAAPKPPARPTTARKPVPRMIKVAGSTIFFIVVLGLLATTTGQYIPAIIFGAIFGAVVGMMFGNWPPGPGDDVTAGGE